MRDHIYIYNILAVKMAVQPSVLAGWSGHLWPFRFRKKCSDWLLHQVLRLETTSPLSSPSTHLRAPITKFKSLEISAQTTPDSPWDLTSERFTFGPGMRTEGMLSGISFLPLQPTHPIYSSFITKFPLRRLSIRPCFVRLFNSAPNLVSASFSRLHCSISGPTPFPPSIAIPLRLDFLTQTTPDSPWDLRSERFTFGPGTRTEGMLLGISFRQLLLWCFISTSRSTKGPLSRSDRRPASIRIDLAM